MKQTWKHRTCLKTYGNELNTFKHVSQKPNGSECIQNTHK